MELLRLPKIPKSVKTARGRSEFQSGLDLRVGRWSTKGRSIFARPCMTNESKLLLRTPTTDMDPPLLASNIVQAHLRPISPFLLDQPVADVRHDLDCSAALATASTSGRIMPGEEGLSDIQLCLQTLRRCVTASEALEGRQSGLPVFPGSMACTGKSLGPYVSCILMLVLIMNPLHNLPP